MTIFSWIGALFSSDAAYNEKLYRDGKADRNLVTQPDPRRGMGEAELEKYEQKSKAEQKHRQRTIRRRG
jgi:hypothetical protein